MTDQVIPDELDGLGTFGQQLTGEGADCAPATRAKRHWGIQYQGSYEADNDGTARAVRLHARALEAAGLPVFLESFTGRFLGPDGSMLTSNAISEAVRAETESVRTADIGNLVLRIKHVVPSTPEALRSQIIPRFVQKERDVGTMVQMLEYVFRTTIVYSVWERTTVDPLIVQLLSRVAECWVPCEQNKALLQDHGVERVVVVPHPFLPADDMVKLTRRKPIAERRFYSIGTWQPRKGFHELIGAFLMAFKPGGAERLSIKYRDLRWPDYPSPEESVKHWFEHPIVKANGWTLENASSHLQLFGAHWGQGDILKFHFQNNIYVASSRGEAFCLPAFDAKVAGNAMVHVAFGGTVDFAGPGDVAVKVEFLEPVPTSYRWDPNTRWAGFAVHDLSAGLARAQAPKVFERPAGFERFAFNEVGKFMRERVLAVLRREMPTLEGLPV